MVDTDISDTSLRMSLVTSDNTVGGKAAGKALGEAVGGKGEVLYVGYTPARRLSTNASKGSTTPWPTSRTSVRRRPFTRLMMRLR